MAARVSSGLADGSAVHGRCADQFAGLREAFADSLARGEEIGASVSVVLDGEPVVDLHGGRMGADDMRPWSQDTIVNVYSITKTMTVLAALLLVDRGELDLDASVASYWPEFAAAGKGGIEVRHLLSHSSGLAGWAVAIDLDGLCDLPQSTALLAAQEPWWQPGTASGYHAMDFGHLVGELVHRITGQGLGEFFADEIAGPLGADFHIGTAATNAHRIATLSAPPARASRSGSLDPGTVAHRTLTNPVVPVESISTPLWREAVIGAANGHGNARSVARLQSVLSSGGEAGGVRLLSERTVRRVLEQQTSGTDLVLGMPIRWGLGLALGPVPAVPDLPGRDLCWWGGYGGSIVVNDLEQRMTFAYVMNRMTFGLVGSERANRYLRATYAALAR